MLVLISQLGICMLTSIFLCVFLGKVLMDRLHCELIFPAFLLVGILAGFRSCYSIICRFIRLGEKEEKREKNERNNERK